MYPQALQGKAANSCLLPAVPTAEQTMDLDSQTTSSTTTTTTSMTPVQKVYSVGCCGTGYVAMSEERAEQIFTLMPTLRFLLLGHPQMAHKKVVERDDDGVTILEIPEEFDVTKESFLLLINCLFEAEPLPARCGRKKERDDGRLKDLIETMATLGGCDVLERRLKDHHANPLTPEDDSNDRYEWHILRYGKYHDIDDHEMVRMKKYGFSFTTSKMEHDQINFYYRAKKGAAHPPVENPVLDHQAVFRNAMQQMNEQLAAHQQEMDRQLNRR